MELSQQVITLQQAKKLAELGVERDSLYTWDSWAKPARLVRSSQCEVSSYDKPELFHKAYTVAELGEMLPVEISDEIFRGPGNIFLFTSTRWKMKKGLFFEVGYGWGGSRDTWLCNDFPIININEAQARAEALIWLLEQKLLTAQQINEAA